MFMQSVNSSNIKAVGYDKGTHQLRVEFSNGGTYNYADVPEQAHKALVSAKSIGSYLHANIKGKYAHSRHEE